MLPPGVERYKLAGGGSLILPIEAGDQITMTDLEVCSPAKYWLLGMMGRSILEFSANMPMPSPWV